MLIRCGRVSLEVLVQKQMLFDDDLEEIANKKKFEISTQLLDGMIAQSKQAELFSKIDGVVNSYFSGNITRKEAEERINNIAP